MGGQGPHLQLGEAEASCPARAALQVQAGPTHLYPDCIDEDTEAQCCLQPLPWRRTL